jgi:hypothetical protein
VRGDEDEEEQGRGGMTHHEELTKKIFGALVEKLTVRRRKEKNETSCLVVVL